MTFTCILLLIYLDKQMKNQSTSIAQSEQIIEYTQYCLLVTIVVFIVTKLLSSKLVIFNDDNNLSKQTSSKTFAETSSISIQTEIKQDYFVPNNKNIFKRERTISVNKSVQTPINVELDDVLVHQPRRTVNQCLDFLREKKNIDDFLEEEIIELVQLKHIPLYKLETYFTDPIRGINLR